MLDAFPGLLYNSLPPFVKGFLVADEFSAAFTIIFVENT